MKGLILIALFSALFCLIQAQESKKLKIINAHIGVGANNLINAEAPHKILRYDNYRHYPFYEGSELNYETNFLSDMKFSFVGGIGFEYYLKPGMSFSASVNYEGKGLEMNYRFNDSGGNEQYIWDLQEDYLFDISNHYITLPLSLRKYLNASYTFYVQGGVYMACMFESRVDISIVEKFNRWNIAEEHEEPRLVGYYIEEFNANHFDFEDELTRMFDFGLVLGTGYIYPLSKKLFINADLLFSIGLKGIDGVNDNEYDELLLARGTMVRSGNYYGLNSNAKNFSGELTVGIGIKL
ncbi:outer membrane beta-barrel protein [Carboxylicivirga marina]|uniref:PorT family protein n=1 Tax=Carboxylicivirga marina TaxID=2800988 RepID=A0ABS1HF05_9BACT|nr:outer membrane beta-barrel protein [Carboxylicivirga marina]MBK3516246.1 PorT family protein [Carboxylicivirga marina]